jgi:hypothetical protein
MVVAGTVGTGAVVVVVDRVFGPGAVFVALVGVVAGSVVVAVTVVVAVVGGDITVAVEVAVDAAEVAVVVTVRVVEVVMMSTVRQPAVETAAIRLKANAARRNLFLLSIGWCRL